MFQIHCIYYQLVDKLVNKNNTKAQGLRARKYVVLTLEPYKLLHCAVYLRSAKAVDMDPCHDIGRLQEKSSYQFLVD